MVRGIKFVNVMDIFRSNCLYSCDVIGSVQASENQRVSIFGEIWRCLILIEPLRHQKKLT